MDEYHLTGIALDTFVKWERRAPSSADGRGENRNEGRGDGKPKSEQKKFDEGHFTEGMVGHSAADRRVEKLPVGPSGINSPSSVPQRPA